MFRRRQVSDSHVFAFAATGERIPPRVRSHSSRNLARSPRNERIRIEAGGRLPVEVPSSCRKRPRVHFPPMKRAEIVESPDRLSAVEGGVFVPTMGALHEGHLALIRLARSLGGPVITSIFVNPTQFGPGEDFDRYPRTMEADVDLATEAGTDLVYAPSAETVYPDGLDHPPSIPLPPVATDPGLEDAGRPHFSREGPRTRQVRRTTPHASRPMADAGRPPHDAPWFLWSLGCGHARGP